MRESLCMRGKRGLQRADSAPRGLDLPYRDQLVLFICPQTLIGS